MHRGDQLVSAQARPVYDRWRDVEGIHIADGCRVEQVAVHRELGALRCRLHKRGEVVGRTNSNRVYVQFDGEPPRLVSIRPHLLRVVPVVLDMHGLIVQDIVGELACQLAEVARHFDWTDEEVAEASGGDRE